MARTRISERRELLTFDGDDGEPAYISMWIDGVQIAAGIRQDDFYATRNGGARWSLWSAGLVLRYTPEEAAITFGQPRPEFASHPLACHTQADMRAWLDLLADLAEHGPRIVETRRIR